MKNELKKMSAQNILQIGLQISGVLVLILNLYLATQLYPLAEGIRKNEFRVIAIESDYARKSTVDSGFAHVTKRLDQIDTQLNRLEDKIDAIR